MDVHRTRNNQNRWNKAHQLAFIHDEFNTKPPPIMQTTYEHPWNIQLRLLENTTNLDAESTQSPAKESLGQKRTDLSKNRKGDIAELYVCLIAQWKGADVFRNVGCDGKTDIVLKTDGNLVEIDVKLSQWNKRDKRWYSPHSCLVEPPVYPVMVEPEGDIMNWKIRWKNSWGTQNNPQCPPGLEDFWSKPSTKVEQ